MESIRVLKKIIYNAPNLLQGYNLYVNRNKFRLIDLTIEKILNNPESFADLGGVWRVNAAYTRYTLKNYNIKRAFLVDTNFSPSVTNHLRKYQNLTMIKDDFSGDEVVQKIAKLDIVFLFDVLLHQVNPDWDKILEKYASITNCFIIFNQQICTSQKTIRLTDLPLDEYINLVPRRSDDFYDYIYNHKDEIHPEYQKPWKDVHNIWQWGITDDDLRKKMADLGFEEKFYNNYGQFVNLSDFEDHAFVFLKR